MNMDTPYQQLCQQASFVDTDSKNEIKTFTGDASSVYVADAQPQLVAQSSPHNPMKPPHVAVGPQSSFLQCPHCTAFVKTTVKHTVTTRTHIVSALCCCLCCCFPYCMDSARNADHYCANCQKYINTYEK